MRVKKMNEKRKDMIDVLVIRVLLRSRARPMFHNLRRCFLKKTVRREFQFLTS